METLLSWTILAAALTAALITLYVVYHRID